MYTNKTMALIPQRQALPWG